MVENQDYIYLTKSDINEGLSTGTVTKAAIFFTKNYIFVIPFDSTNIFGGGGVDKKFKDIHQYIKDLISRIQDTHIEDFENEMKTILPDERVFEVAELEKLKVDVGFAFFGGLSFKRKNEQRKVATAQPKKKRKQIKEFYGL